MKEISVKSYPMTVLLHLLAFITFGYSLFWTFNHMDVPTKHPDGQYGGRLKYLTYWDLWIQFITFTICLLTDFKPNANRNTSKLIQLRDSLYNCLAFPIGFFVVSSFWAIYFVDRELIFPTGIEKWYPIWLNHTTHTFIVPILLIENYLVSHNRSAQTNGLTILITTITVYMLWILFIAETRGHWVYPVLEVLTWPLRVCFILGSGLLMIAFYYLGDILYSHTWKSAQKLRIESLRKKAK
jgi:hypothetical protein